MSNYFLIRGKTDPKVTARKIPMENLKVEMEYPANINCIFSFENYAIIDIDIKEISSRKLIEELRNSIDRFAINLNSPPLFICHSNTGLHLIYTDERKLWESYMILKNFIAPLYKNGMQVSDMEVLKSFTLYSNNFVNISEKPCGNPIPIGALFGIVPDFCQEDMNNKQKALYDMYKVGSRHMTHEYCPFNPTDGGTKSPPVSVVLDEDTGEKRIYCHKCKQGASLISLISKKTYTVREWAKERFHFAWCEPAFMEIFTDLGIDDIYRSAYMRRVYYFAMHDELKTDFTTLLPALDLPKYAMKDPMIFPSVNNNYIYYDGTEVPEKLIREHIEATAPIQKGSAKYVLKSVKELQTNPLFQREHNVPEIAEDDIETLLRMISLPAEGTYIDDNKALAYQSFQGNIRTVPRIQKIDGIDMSNLIPDAKIPNVYKEYLNKNRIERTDNLSIIDRVKRASDTLKDAWKVDYVPSEQILLILAAVVAKSVGYLNGIPIVLTGPSGTGKSTITKICAEALYMPFCIVTRLEAEKQLRINMAEGKRLILFDEGGKEPDPVKYLDIREDRLNSRALYKNTEQVNNNSVVVLTCIEMLDDWINSDQIRKSFVLAAELGTSTSRRPIASLLRNMTEDIRRALDDFVIAAVDIINLDKKALLEEYGEFNDFYKYIVTRPELEGIFSIEEMEDNNSIGDNSEKFESLMNVLSNLTEDNFYFHKDARARHANTYKIGSNKKKEYGIPKIHRLIQDKGREYFNETNWGNVLGIPNIYIHVAERRNSGGDHVFFIKIAMPHGQIKRGCRFKDISQLHTKVEKFINDEENNS